MAQSSISRRSFLKGTGAIAVGAVAAGGLAACSGTPQQMASTQGAEEVGGSAPAFLVAPGPITEFAVTEEYDVVVVGAGEAGLSAIHSALEAGASVGCLQQLDTPRTTGNMAASIDLDKTSEAGVNACVSFINWRNNHRSDRRLVNVWARNSFEAIGWWADCSKEGGVESVPHDSVLNHNGYDIHLHANTYFHAEGGHNAAAQVIGEQLAQQGASFHFNTPCVQLLTEDGAITGAIGKQEDGSYILLKATKGVILATGDYSGNTEMSDYYAPDLKGFPPFIEWRDGSGLCAGMWAGAVMTPPTHTKMIHGDFAPTRLEMPFLFLDGHGNRFMDESYSRMAYLNNYHRTALAEAGFSDCYATRIFTIVPENWEAYYEAWKAGSPQEISIYNADRKVDPSQWISGGNPEELAEAMVAYVKENGWNIDLSADAIVAQINRYNELCRKGADDDFGKRSEYMVPIEGSTIYAVDRGAADGLSAILGGLVVNENHQCLDENFEPLTGLFAVGNASGQFFGGVDYPMDIEGLSIGRAITSGYVCGAYVAQL